jgi:hypothetical protein
VLRFKGRAAPCVILTEIDFDSLDDKAMRRLFVGATRATMKLTLVVLKPRPPCCRHGLQQVKARAIALIRHAPG